MRMGYFGQLDWIFRASTDQLTPRLSSKPLDENDTANIGLQIYGCYVHLCS